MSFDTARRDIEQRFTDNWALTKIAYDNVEFVPKEGEAWTEISIFEDRTRRINIGRPGRHRTTGTIIIGIYVPVNTGTAVARGYAADIADIFRDQTFNGITTTDPSVSNAGRDRQWYKLNMSIPFRWDGEYL